MAASATSLGPPSVGPGSLAQSVGFAVSATTHRGVCTNKEPLSGNTLCHKSNVERKHAIHESRLASVKASLSLSTPRRMEFMDKRLSKNFHVRRHHAQVVQENLKILRALEEIHSRSSTTVAVGIDNSITGGGCLGDGGRGTSTAPVSAKKSKGLLSASTTNAGRSPSRKKLSSLLARKRNVKAALVSRENQKMMERMTRSKSLYSREKMRQHRVRHQRILRLRKTDYTAGHLLAAETANRRWTGGDSRDEGFAYSFEEGRSRHGPRHRHRHRHTQRNRSQTLGGGSGRAQSSTSPPTGISRGVHCSSAVARGTSYSPTRGLNSCSSRKGVGRGRATDRETKSAPRLPSLLDVEDVYGGGSILGSPNLEQCRLAAEMSGRSDGVGNGRAWGSSGSRASSSRNSTRGSGNHEADSSRSRPSSGGGNGSRGGSRNKRSKDTAGGGGGGGGSSICGVRGTDTSADSLSHRRGSCLGLGEDVSGLPRGARFAGRRSKGGGGSRGETSTTSDGNLGDEDDLDKIFNPLAFLNEMKGVRVLIQATKPLEVLNHAGETWICFIRITVKDPFDDQLDIRVIHDREEVCRRVLSLEEANAICECARKASGDQGTRDRLYSIVSPPRGTVPTVPGSAGAGAPIADTTATAPLSALSSTVINPTAGAQSEGAVGSESDLHARLSVGLGQCSANHESLGDVLSTLFKAADTENKGFLTTEQLTSIMQNAELGLTGPELHLVIAEADENADGTIDYYEFIPLAYNLVNAFQARRRACDQMNEENLDMDQQAIHALYDAEFDRLVRQVKALCKSQDPNGKGVLPRAEFKQCISSDRLGGLTKIESKLLLNLLPKDSHGNVIYRKLGAGLEQVRFTTLRNTVAEASATDTHKYLMNLCREEDGKSDLGSKGHLKTSGDSPMALGGKHYSGVLRARQLTKLLLNAPLLSLSRLHVTALMSQAHIVDGMVNYVELVPMIAKTIEGMFHPQSLKMRYEIFKNRGTAGGGGGVAGGGGGGGGGGMGEGGSQGAAMTVLGKSRDDIQRIFVDVLRKDNLGAGIERLKDPETFARCMASLGLDLVPDTISALWVAADLDSREGTTFVDVVDFCFNCVLFMEQEKEMKTMQQARNSTARASQGGLTGREAPGVAAVARAEAVAAAALAAGGEAPTGKVEPLLSLARALVRHAKVTAPSEGKVGLEFLLDRHTPTLENDGSTTTPGDDTSRSVKGESGAGRQRHAVDVGYLPLLSDAENMTAAASMSTNNMDEEDADSSIIGGGEEGSTTAEGEGGATAGLQLRSEAPGAKVFFRARRKIPIVGESGQPIMGGSAAVGTATPSSGPQQGIHGDGGPTMTSGKNKNKTARQRESSGILEKTEAARGETRDMIIQVYWDGAAKDRAHIEAYPANNKCDRGREEIGEEGSQCPLLRLGVRVPTLAIVDAEAALKFAERVVQRVSIQMEDDMVCARGKRGGGQRRQQHGETLRLAGVDVKSVVAGD